MTSGWWLVFPDLIHVATPAATPIQGVQEEALERVGVMFWVLK